MAYLPAAASAWGSVHQEPRYASCLIISGIAGFSRVMSRRSCSSIYGALVRSNHCSILAFILRRSCTGETYRKIVCDTAKNVRISSHPTRLTGANLLVRARRSLVIEVARLMIQDPGGRTALWKFTQSLNDGSATLWRLTAEICDIV